ncbi:zinc finger protein hangover [Diorhabda carinulata]|uniref:zinc finger protein hangover n=1 Tax=Diorhabda carinulata TaxID=1163345 RepID=UPI0025A29926|nr:zinc finger protein hangover [Diorhabda carinulata]
MTSVTLPSSSGTLNGGYSSSVTEKLPTTQPDFDALRTIKRSLCLTSTESCKKRRKQSTPIRISTSETESQNANSLEGKPIVPSPEPNHRCSICQQSFSYPEQLQNHIICEHPLLECKKEPEDHPTTPSSVSYVDQSETPMGLSIMRSDIPWVNEIQNKEWIGSNLSNLSFNPANPMFMTLPPYSHTDNISLKPIRIFNPDAYCDLCNKEFCNKYFLKTHKANKHGIYTDSSSSEPLLNSVTVPSITSNLKISNPVPTVEQPTITSDSKTPANMINAFNNIFQNPFSNQANLSENEINENIAMSNGMSSSSESDKIFSDDPHAEENSSPCIQTESTSIKNDPDGLFHDTSSKLSSDQTNRELDLSYRLRKIGVMNPKAFCEICCKEYCNKYFLRTHKLKRHGIYIPDDKDKDIRSECMSGFPSSNVQTSPLNLIMTEQGSSDSKITSPTSIGCDICCIKFQNASLAQLHNVSVHARVSSIEPEECDRSQQDSTKISEGIKSNEKSVNPETISEDLQKLQTMILQLNDIDTAKVTTNCAICNKEFENRFYLQAHMLSEHSMLMDEGDCEKAGDTELRSTNNAMCDICGKELLNVEELSRHIVESHSNHQVAADSSKDDNSGFTGGDKSSNRLQVSSGHIPERRVSMNVTPTSSYCEICNKELCNKYFMKTHMQRMHGIEIENGAQIGGVVCDICNKELCSKYFLRVHKHNTHGIIEYGGNLLPPRKSDGESSVLPSPSTPLETDSTLKPTDLADLSHRYFTHFTEVCTICSRRFRSTKWLKAHLITDHGQVGAEKWAEIEIQLQQRGKVSTTTNSEGNSNLKIPNGSQDMQQQKVGGVQNFISSLFGIDESNSKMYQCSYCPFTSPLLPLLFVHERSHMNMEGFSFKCPICPQNFTERKLLERHILSRHSFLLPNTVKEEDTITKEMSKESSEDDDPSRQEFGTSSQGQLAKLSSPIKVPSDIEQSLMDVAKRMQWPATYAIPQRKNQSEQDQDEASSPSGPGYVMQAFLLEESASERRVMPSVVFLPMLQKQPAPITVTFTLTPA